MVILATVFLYFLVLLGISRLVSRQSTNESFFRADRRSPWYMVAFGMVGASISGVTFVSVPGMVQSTQMTYLQMCLGFIVGYVAIAFLLLPLYYRLGLTSIYAYLGQRLGRRAYLTGAWFFLLSKMTGAALKFYVVCIILQRFVFDAVGVPFWANVAALVALIWLYTHRGGIKTLVVTDSLQTLCLLAALLLILHNVVGSLGMTLAEAAQTVAHSHLSRVFVFDDWLSPQNFWKQFLSGIFIVIVMTGLDQDMMQKNLTCRTLRDAQKDVCSYGVAFVPVNLLFLALGVLLTMVPALTGVSGDELLPAFVSTTMGTGGATAVSPVAVFFTLGIVASSFSSADSALTSLTTICCVDICHRPTDEQLRRRVHVAVCVVFMAFVLLYRVAGSTSLLDAIYTLVGYTYGPLLGLFAFGLCTNRNTDDRRVPAVCVASPIVSYALSLTVSHALGWQLGYELLMVNGLLTFAGLWIFSHNGRLATKPEESGRELC